MEAAALSRALRSSPLTDRASYDGLQRHLADAARQGRAYALLWGAFLPQARRLLYVAPGLQSLIEARLVVMYALWGFGLDGGGGRKVPGALDVFLDTPAEEARASLSGLMWSHVRSNKRFIARALQRDTARTTPLDLSDADVEELGAQEPAERVVWLRQAIDGLLEHPRLSERQREVVRHLAEHPDDDQQDIARMFGVSEATLSRDLKEIRTLAVGPTKREEKP